MGRAVSLWLLSEGPSSDAARAFRRLWAQRWQGTHPGWLTQLPSAAYSDHRHAYPEFRNPLGSEEGLEASRVFHRDVIRRLAAEETQLLLVTLDVVSVWHEDGVRHEWRDEETAGAVTFDREEWLEMILDLEEFEETNGEDYAVAHAFVSAVGIDDPRLEALWAETAAGERVLVTNTGLDWIARPNEECVSVAAFAPSVLDALRAAEQASYERWGIPARRDPVVDLAEVAAHIATSSAEWSRRGVEITTGPQYRCWDEDTTHIESTPPADWGDADWIHLEMSGPAADAMVTVHDTGTCDILPLVEDEDAAIGQILARRRGHAGELDESGLVAALEHVVATLAGRATQQRPDVD